MSATDAAIQKIIYGSGATALIVSNEEMEHMKIVKYLKNQVSELVNQLKIKQENKKADLFQCY